MQPQQGKPTKKSVSPNKARALATAIHCQQKLNVVVAPKPRSIRSQNRLLFEDEYQDEVTEYMHAMEVSLSASAIRAVLVLMLCIYKSTTLASAELMDMQPELQWYMRPFLVDFLIEIHQQFRLRPEVLYLAMNIVDRYVSKRVVYKKHYQLVGCAALWIAAKFEDAKDRVPTVRELADMCCKAYDETAFIQMEGHVLQTIGWTIGHPTAEAWMRMACMGNDKEDTRTQHIARFLMEITLFHREFVGVKPSVLAAGSLMVARFICGLHRHVSSMYQLVQYSALTCLVVRSLFIVMKKISSKWLVCWTFASENTLKTFLKSSLTNTHLSITRTLLSLLESGTKLVDDGYISQCHHRSVQLRALPHPVSSPHGRLVASTSIQVPTALRIAVVPHPKLVTTCRVHLLHQVSP